MKKYSLKTLPKAMTTKDFCLDHLAALLDKFSGHTLLRELAYMGRILDLANNLEEGNQELVKKYASERMKMDLRIDAAGNKNILLFNRFALKLIDELLRIKFPKTSVSQLYESSKNANPYVWRNGLLVRASKLDSPSLPIEGIFLLANTLITIIQEESSVGKNESSEQARFFYGNLRIDKSAAIGRCRMYRYGNFPSRLKQIGIDIEGYSQAMFSLCAHVESQPFIELELPSSFKQMNASSQEILLKYLPRISKKIKSQVWDFKESNSLSKLYYTDFLCRQHPLIEEKDRYYCLEPHLLWASLPDLPFYQLLDSFKNDKKKGDTLWKEWGSVFEDNWRDLGQRVFGADKCEPYFCQKKHPDLNLLQKEHRIGDLFVTLNTTTRIIFEFKGVAADDPIKLGDRSRARLKLIQQIDQDQGVPQLVRDAYVYRKETSFNEIVFTIFVCRGPIPPTSDFDIDVKNYLNDLSAYQDYLSNPKNQPVIWLDFLSAEFLFSGLRQGLPVEEILKALAGMPPSQIPKTIGEKMKQYGFDLSLSSLYAEEIESQIKLCRSMFSDACETST